MTVSQVFLRALRLSLVSTMCVNTPTPDNSRIVNAYFAACREDRLIPVPLYTQPALFTGVLYGGHIRTNGKDGPPCRPFGPNIKHTFTKQFIC